MNCIFLLKNLLYHFTGSSHKFRSNNSREIRQTSCSSVP